MHPHKHLDNLNFGMIKDCGRDVKRNGTFDDWCIPDKLKQSNNPWELFVVKKFAVGLSVNPAFSYLLLDLGY